jgi:trans-aconitate methyltransferase
LNQANIRSILDFGCGTGNGIQFLDEAFQPEELFGVDTSEESLAHARSRFPKAVFRKPSSLAEETQFDLAYCNGVFHHIPLDARVEVVRYLYSHVKPGGYFAFWENNPWNPGTRYVMSRIPFDHDAITLSIPAAKSILTEGGFRILRVETKFYFPRVLAWFRVLEPWLASLPLGAQYMILSQRPVT